MCWVTSINEKSMDLKVERSHGRNKEKNRTPIWGKICNKIIIL